MTPNKFRVSRSKVKVTVTFKLRWGIHVSQTFLVILFFIVDIIIFSGSKVRDLEYLE